MRIEDMTREEMIAVIRRLPRTADDRPAYHGMKVWRRCGLDGAIIGETLTLRCDPDGGTTPEEVYSTREAALAAAEAKP